MEGWSIKEYYVFLASPGDVQDERQAVRRFFADYNALLVSSGRTVRFVVIDWENYSTIGVGRPQELITKQTLERFRDSLALVIGIMGQRFGSPSGTHESGTQEEFEWAFISNQQTGWPEMKWFFRNADEVKFPSDRKLARAALDQWDKVCEFRDRLNQGKQIFVGEFKDSTDFRERLRKDLSLWLEAPEQPWRKEPEARSTRVSTEHAAPASTVKSPVIAPVMSMEQREAVRQRYLQHVIGRTRSLQVQGIRSGGQLVHIELEQIYVTLKATRTRTREAEEEWLTEEQRLAPGEGQKLQHLPRTETMSVKVEEALGEHKHLVVLGDPGSGKTTLLRYLALCYARDVAERSTMVRDRLALPESGFLPVLIPLRNLGAYLRTKHASNDGVEGHGRLLNFLHAYLLDERVIVPEDFFDGDLDAGRAVILFDGMDEVGDFDLRRRVARLIEKFATRYSACRIVVTSRIVGYAGAARLGEGFATTTIRDFTLSDVRQFLSHWHRQVAIGQRGPGEAAENFVAAQTQQLIEAIENNPRVRELAINPLMLTVIALVHRDRVKLPERRAELYAEAVDVLLGKWDEAREVEAVKIFDDRPFDTGDRRLLLQTVALSMHEAGQKEIEVDPLQKQLRAIFASMTLDSRAAERATQRFLAVIQERTGLLVEAGQGVYRFSHLTFQEYLTAVEVAERDDYIPYTLRRASEPFWREAILLEAGYLSTKNRAKTARLIQAIADSPNEPEPFHNLVLAAECIRDVGSTRVEGNLPTVLRQRLQVELEKPIPTNEATWLTRLLGRMSGTAERRRAIIARRIAAVTALSRIESGNFGTGSAYWSLPHGEPPWITIPAGEFWMGSDEYAPEEQPVHRLFVSEFRMARTPVTNAQYWLYVQATGAETPRFWEDGQPPKDKLYHPVTRVSWHDAQQYCEWLSTVTGKRIRLPTEAEWEKAARGDKDKRAYPWGDQFDATKCSSIESGLQDTSPVGTFLSGVSLYGCLDMSGNVWEWCEDWYDEQYYQRGPQRNLQGPDSGESKVLRGGSWGNGARNVRVAYRNRAEPDGRYGLIGFRCAQ